MNIVLGLIFQLINIGSDEIWERKEAVKGSHIRVFRGLYFHHGIYISDEEVIHYCGYDGDGLTDFSECKVIITNIEDFLRGGILEVRQYKKNEKKYLHSIEHIVGKARESVGKNEYNLIFNNCEHFANECAFGRKKSTQVNNIMCGRILSDTSSAIFVPMINFLIGKKSMGILLILGALASFTLNADTKKKKVKKENHRKTADTVKPDTERRLENEVVYERDYKIQEIIDSTLSIQEKSEILNQKRIQIIEQGSLDMIKEIENSYFGMLSKIKNEHEDYIKLKLPDMFKNLERYEGNKEIYDMYRKIISEDMSMRMKHYEKYMDMFILHQNMIIQSIIDNKNKIVKKSGVLFEETVYENKLYA